MSRWSDLTDDQLANELRRRAEDASLGADWTRLQLLPVVQDGAARGSMQPRRLTLLARLSVALAVVLVLAISVPLLTPAQPPATTSPAATTPAAAITGTASPTASPGPSPTDSEQGGEISVLTAAEFAVALRADQLEKQTVLVDAAILPGPPVRGPACRFVGPGQQPCYFGQLEGVEPALSVSAEPVAHPGGESSTTLNGPGIDWPHWWLPSAPVRGLLLLFVRGGTVTYVGRVQRDGSSLTWSVGEAKAVDPSSLAPDEVLLVDGWLNGVGLVLRCLPLPENAITGLPNRWCSNSGWLFDGPDRRVRSPADRTGGIELQDQAYYQFALGPEPQRFGDGDGQPRQGTYALRPRLEGWCPDRDAPCWQWSAAGRVSADFIGIPARTIECGRISFTIGSRGTSGTPANIRDETGLVDRCTASWTSPESSGVVIENPLPNAVSLKVSWPGTMCDLSTAFEFRSAGGGYELVGETATEACADDSVVRHQLMIGLAMAAPARLVRVTVNGISGTEAPPAPTPAAAVLPCSTDQHHATVLDQTGFVDACRTVDGTAAVDSIALVDFFGEGEFGLRVLWTGSACDDMPLFRLYQSGMRFTLEGELYGEPCGPENVAFEVQLLLNTDLIASAIDASLRHLSGPAPIPLPETPVASADFDTAEGTFTLTARAGKATYRASEPIDIAGEIVWHGPAGSTIQVFGGTTDVTDELVHFGWEQLDGDLQIGPRFHRSCKSTTLVADVPVTVAIAKETGNFGSQDPFWRDFFATPEFTLPPGRYKVMARTQFSIGECDPSKTIMYVPIFIDVTE